MNKKIIAVMLFVLVTVPFFSGCLEESGTHDTKPVVEIISPANGDTVSNIIIISGTASDADGNDTIKKVEVKINDLKWNNAMGTTKWSFDWRTYEIDDGLYNISVRCWDGTYYSEVKEINVYVSNPKDVDSGNHKWGVFIVSSNFPKDNESKLGNGGLYLAEEMSEYFIENLGYSTSNIFILFDDGWIRGDNGYGKKIETLYERPHKYDVTYGGATKDNTVATLQHVVEESNKFDDSEVFLWIFSHGCGDEDYPLTGGKILDTSAIFLWDDILTDSQLGELLLNLRSDKTCIIVDACYSGGFADKTIYNLPTLFLMKSNIPRDGRVVISAASKFRKAWTSTTQGPLFTLIWFEGLTSGEADGFISGIGERGRHTKFKFFKDGKTSVEEAFYYTKYVLRTDETFDDFKDMQPQMNDQYPHKGFLRSMKGLILGE